MMKCTLPKYLNDCQFFNEENSSCYNPECLCAFQEEMIEKSREKEKKEKWFEKYYK